MEKTTKAVVAEVKRQRPDEPSQKPEAGSTGASRKVSPCAYQTEDEIATYYRKANAGDVAVVRQTQGHLLVYAATEVEGLNSQIGRVYIKQHGAILREDRQELLPSQRTDHAHRADRGCPEVGGRTPARRVRFRTFPPDRTLFKG